MEEPYRRDLLNRDRLRGCPFRPGESEGQGNALLAETQHLIERIKE
jgi:hypothetical protein